MKVHKNIRTTAISLASAIDWECLAIPALCEAVELYNCSFLYTKEVLFSAIGIYIKIPILSNNKLYFLVFSLVTVYICI